MICSGCSVSSLFGPSPCVAVASVCPTFCASNTGPDAVDLTDTIVSSATLIFT